MSNVARHICVAALLLLVAAAAVRDVVFLARFASEPPFYKYLTLADSVVAGDLPADRMNDVSPLYLWTVSAGRAVHLTPTALSWIQILATLAAALYVGLTARKLAGDIAGLCAALAMLASRTVVLNASELEPEVLILLLNALAIWLLFGKERPSPFLSGMAAAASMMTRPTALLPLIVLAVTAPSSAFGTFSPASRGRRALDSKSSRDPSIERGALDGTASRDLSIERGALDGTASRDLSIERPSPPVKGEKVPKADEGAWKHFLAGAAIPIVVILGINVAVTHQPIIMNGGTVFYEGMNPHAIGYSGVRPAVVDDLRVWDPTIGDKPDALHLAFRSVVSRIHHDAATPEETNRYWTGKGLAFARELPGEAVRLTLRKLFFAIHSYEAWDVRRTEERSAIVGPVWLPFGLLFALALIALAVSWRDRRIFALACIVAVYIGAMAVFHVTSRQRNALMPAIAVLAGVAIAKVDAKRGVAAVLVTILLTYEYPPQREYDYFEDEKLVVNSGRIRDQALLMTYPAAIDRDLPLAQATVHAVALRELARATSDARRFDIAHGLIAAGEWELADHILEDLEDNNYQPWRGLAVVPSVAFYRSIALLHLNHPAQARHELLEAQAEAPGDDSVLALTAIALRDRESARRLFALYDPFTARLAVVRAYMVLRRLPEALSAASALTRDLPEWKRAEFIRSELSAYPISR